MSLKIFAIVPDKFWQDDIAEHLGQNAAEHWKERWRKETLVGKITLVQAYTIEEGWKKYNKTLDFGMVIAAAYIPEDKKGLKSWEVDGLLFGHDFNGGDFIRELRGRFQGPIIAAKNGKELRSFDKRLKRAGADYVHGVYGLPEFLLNIVKARGVRNMRSLRW